MDIKEYAQMMKYLTRPKETALDIDDENYGEGRLNTIPKTWLQTMPVLKGAPDPETSIKELATGGRIGFKDGYGPFEIKMGPEKGKFKLKFTSANPEGKAMYFDTKKEAQNYLDTRGEKLEKAKIKREYNPEREKASKYLYNKKYRDLNKDEKQKVRTRISSTGKFTAKKAKDPLTARQQGLILKEFPDADFSINKYGFPREGGMYDKVNNFVKRGYKLRAFKPLSKPLQRAIVENFPEYKNFNFKTNLYGVPSGKGANMKLYDRIRTFVDDPKPFQFAFNLRSPEGWTMAQMYRAGDDKYEPIRNENEKITGFKDKTGKTVRTYNIKNINKHPNFPEIQKYYNVAELSRTPLSKYENVVKLLPKGFDPNKILLNDLLQFIADKDGLTGINRAKRAIEIHHTKGVKNQATGNFQLLRSDLNKLADTIEQQIKKGNLDRVAELEANKIRVETGGKKFGSRKVSPMGDFKQIVSGVESELKGFSKKNWNNLSKQLLGKLEARGCGQAAGGRILFSEGSPGGTMTKCAKKGVQGFIDDLKKGNYSKATKDILKGGGQFLKGALNPMDMLKLRNLIGPTAMGFLAAFEGGVITDDVIRQGTPLNESLANNWLTKSFLPYTQEYAKAKNLLATGKVPANMKKYVQDVMTFNDALKDIQAIESNVASRIVDQGGYGMIDGTSVYTQEQQDKDDANVMKKLSTLTENVVTPGSAKDLEMKSLQDENEATRMAKKEFRPLFGFDKLEDVRTPAPTPGINDYTYVPEAVQKDLRPITYQDYERTELPAAERQYYEKKYNISPGSSLSDYSFPGSNTNALEELTNRYNISQASNYPGYYGANEKFMEGGIASLNVKKQK